MKKKILPLDIFVILLILIAVAISIFFPTAEKKLRSNHRFTVAVVTKVEGVLDGDPVASIVYVVSGKQYTGEVSSYQGINVRFKAKDRIYIQFYPPDPDVGQIVHHKAVPDTLKYIPNDGWDSIPCFVPY